MSHWGHSLIDGQNLQDLGEHDQHQVMPALSRKGSNNTTNDHSLS